MKTLTVPQTPEAMGPAMRALNERQRAFVEAMFDLGANATYVEAARRAGYPDDGGSSIRVQAHRLAHSDKVQAAFREEAERRVTALLPTAHGGIQAILANPSHPDHFKAIKHTQALAGFSPTQKHEVVHKHDAASLKADLLAAMDLLRSVAPMIDVTPTKQLPEPTDEECDWVAI